MSNKVFTRFTRQDDPSRLSDPELRRLRRSLAQAINDGDLVPARLTAMLPEEAVEALDEAHNTLRDIETADAATYLVKDILAACREYLCGEKGNAVNSLYYLLAHTIIAIRAVKAGMED